VNLEHEAFWITRPNVGHQFSRSGMQKDLENIATVEQIADLIEFLLLPQ